MNVHDILMKSSNIGSAKMALMMGDEKFYEYVRRFGFGERTGIALPGEIPGLVHPPARWDRLTITRMPMGQSVAVTPLQMAMGMSVIANGGKLMRPQIIKSIQDKDGHEILSMKPEVVREVIPPETASFVGASAHRSCQRTRHRGACARQWISPSPARPARLKRSIPKEAMPQASMWSPSSGTFRPKIRDFVCLILIDDAKLSSGLNYGGLVAAPIFSRVAEKAARYLDLVPAPAATASLPVAFGQSDATKFRQ